MSFLQQLKERNVFKVGVIYIVTAWLLVQVASIALPTFEAPAWVLRVFMFFLLLGFPVALIMAWALELTPEGIKRAEVTVGEKRMWTATAALAIAAIAWFELAAPGLQDAAPMDGQVAAVSEAAAVTDNRESIAVLPFVNMSTSEENEYFSDGLTETLLHMLAQVDDLKVSARTSAFAFKGKNIDVREIASELGVAHILEGSVQRAGDRIRITAQLIKASDGSHLWSENFDRKLDDIFAIQDEIAETVASRLLDELLPAGAVQHPETDSTEAYDLFLRARELNLQRNFSAMDRANELLRRALQIDPDFSDATIEMALNLFYQWSWGKGTPEHVNRALSTLEQHLVENPGDARAEAYLFYMSHRSNVELRGEFEISREQLTQELEQFARQFPNDEFLYQNLAFSYLLSGYPRKAIEVVDNWLERDPMNARFWDVKGRAYELLLEETGEREYFDKAHAAYSRSWELNPDYASGIMRLARLEAMYGSFYRGLEISLASMEADPNDPELAANQAVLLYQVGAIAEADVLAEWTRRIDPAAPVSYALPIERAIAIEDWAAAYEAAARVFEEGIPERWGLHWIAGKGLVIAASETGREREAAELIERAVEKDVFKSAAPMLLVLRMHLMANLLSGDAYLAEAEATRQRIRALRPSGNDDGNECFLDLLLPDPAAKDRGIACLLSRKTSLRDSYYQELPDYFRIPVINALLDHDPSLRELLDDIQAEGKHMRSEAHRLYVDRGLVDDDHPRLGQEAR